MQVSFLYPTGESYSSKEQVATRICQLASLHIDLPEHLIIEFQRMGPSVYGEAVLKPTNNNKIRVNLDLPINDIIYPIVHELLHLGQMYKGQLAISRSGTFVWEGKSYNVDQSKLSYAEYQALPWEEDVRHKFKPLLAKILK